MKKTSSILWGIVLIAVGVIFALNSFNIVSFNIFFDGWWTLFIIVPCAIGIITDNDRMGHLIGLLIGVLLLLCMQNILSFDMIWKLAVPAIIIIVGLKLIFGSVFDKNFENIFKKIKVDGGEMKNGFAAFSGVNMNVDGEVFTGAELNAVFGGVKFDARNAVFDRDCIIDATAVFGGIDIFLPDNVNVKISSTSIFGGVSQKKHNSNTNAVTVYIKGKCMFGGVDIK